MAKLLITLDGVQVADFPVEKERITIGRRDFNDIQLDHIGVSGEHAVLVTILNDSFVEDLGSTNGTLVNGAPVRKHFLRNGDLIEIGRHRLRFIGDVAVTRHAADYEKTMVLNRPSAVPRSTQTGDVLTATVARAPAAATAAELVDHGAAPGVPVFEALVASDAKAEVMKAVHAAAAANLAAEHANALAAAESEVSVPNSVEAEVANALRAEEAAAQPAAEAAPGAVTAPAAESAPAVVTARAATVAPGAEEAPPAVVEPLAELSPAAHQLPADAPASRASDSHARLQVLNGTAAGRILEISKPLTTIGRPDDQVAVISRRSDGYYLAQVDGERPARLNGATLAPHAVALQPHDILEIAGVKLEFFFQA